MVGRIGGLIRGPNLNESDLHSGKNDFKAAWQVGEHDQAAEVARLRDLCLC